MKRPAFPTASQVRDALAPIPLRLMPALALASGVPSHTIYKIKLGETRNPGIDTVGKIWPHIPAVAKLTKGKQ